MKNIDDELRHGVFEADILPLMETSVTNLVVTCIDKEGRAPLSDDFEIVDVTYQREWFVDFDGDPVYRSNRHPGSCRCCKGTKYSDWFRVKIKYRQKLKTPDARPLAVSIRRYLDVGGSDPLMSSFPEERVLEAKNGRKFFFDKCCRT